MVPASIVTSAEDWAGFSGSKTSDPLTFLKCPRTYVTIMCRARNIAAVGPSSNKHVPTSHTPLNRDAHFDLHAVSRRGGRRPSVVPPVVGQREHNRQRDEDAQCECRSEERACDPQQRDNQLNTETPHNVALLADCRLFRDVRMVRDEPHTCQRRRTSGEIGTINCERHRRESVAT